MKQTALYTLTMGSMLVIQDKSKPLRNRSVNNFHLYLYSSWRIQNVLYVADDFLKVKLLYACIIKLSCKLERSFSSLGDTQMDHI